MATKLHSDMNRKFWDEVKRVRGNAKDCARVIDDAVGEDAICDVFASKYEELYSRVSFNADDMVELRRNVDIDIRYKCCKELCYSNHAVTVQDIKEALSKLKIREAENSEAFKKHMTDQISRYGHVSAINLVDQQGKEKVIADTFLRHVLTLNSSDLSYIAFDFHEYCRGMQFENVSILTENILDIIKEMKYCWADQGGLICHQQGVFRVNCMDCLDRTNLVQSAIARIVLEVQCRKLGLLPPDEHLPPKCRSIYQQMWANNGDTVSRQYAGTAALKGDYTRTGERKLTGLMKDGVNSANRYYINRVKDVYRQATIDLMLGSYQFEELLSLLNRSTDSPDSAECESQELLREKEENLKTLIDECKKMLITEPDSCLGGWGLIDCDPITGDPSQQDMDIILLLSQQACYVANYDDETDQVTNYQRIDLNDLVSLELESLQGICESINAAKKLLTSDELSLYEGKLIRKKTRPHPNILSIADQQQEHLKGMGASAKTSSTSVSTSSLLAPTSFLTRVASNPDSLKWAGQKFFNLGRNLEIFNPNSKHFSRVKRKFIPAVLYSKNSDSVPTSESDDSARIIKGESIPETLDSPLIADKPEVMMDHRPLVSSTSDSDLSTCDMDIDFGIFDNHVMLPTCGMLAVKPNQVVTAKIRQRANYKLSRKQSTEARNDVIRRKVRKDIKLKTKSLDLEDRLSSRASSWSGDDPKMNATEFFLSPSEEDEDCDASESEVETAEEDSLVTPTNAIQNIEFPNQEIITPTVEEAQMNFPANDTADITVTISSDGPPVNQSASSNVTPNPSPKSSPLLHPSMKMSFSEGSIATAFHTTEIGSSYENIDLDDLDDLDLSEGHLSRPSTFAKLRGKMPNLSIPTMPSPGAKRKVAERASKQNRIKSQLRFQECKTRIILL
ncbi:hypothetical protein CAPTEDRAFT_213692 [Capitella teleta]|uniref:SAC domain-containing protein n=1 Tax=Capitella teleta TaxID=283909 RepID=R7VF35_CAPTE|nr:hypothetical protein CAPTEDRAFT_213692 [Capitella teleta]|eukprot:ELU14926.1 hypothetical protein CAPTEDRAFT_213692 [Capitella teleta]